MSECNIPTVRVSLRKLTFSQFCVLLLCLSALFLSVAVTINFDADIGLNTGSEAHVLNREYDTDEINNTVSASWNPPVYTTQAPYSYLITKLPYLITDLMPFCYALQNGSSLHLDWINTNASAVQAAAIGNATISGGTILLKDVHFDTSLEIPPNVKVIQEYQGAKILFDYYGNFTISDYNYSGTPSFTVAYESGKYCAKDKYGNITYEGINSATVIQAAFDNLTPDRDWMETVLLKGMLEVDKTLNVSSWTHVKIEGTLKLADDVNDVLIESENTYHVALTSGIVDGNAGGNCPVSGQKCIYFNNVTGGIVSGVTIKNALVAAIDFTKANYGLVEYNHIISPAGDGVALNQGCVSVIVDSNIIEHIDRPTHGAGGSNGIEIQDGTHDCTITNNVIRDRNIVNIVFGVEISSHKGFEAVYNINIINNVIQGMTGGISISAHNSSVSNVKVQGNIVYMGKYGIKAIDCSHTKIECNSFINIDNATYAAIDIDNTNYQIEIANNYCSGGYNGILVECANSSIKGNKVSGAYNSGIIVGGSYCDIESNFILRNGKYGIHLTISATYCILNDNIIMDNGFRESGGQIGLVIASDYTQISNNTVQDTRSGTNRTQRFGISLTRDSSHCQLQGNYVCNNKEEAIFNKGKRNCIEEDNLFHS